MAGASEKPRTHGNLPLDFLVSLASFIAGAAHVHGMDECNDHAGARRPPLLLSERRYSDLTKPGA